MPLSPLLIFSPLRDAAAEFDDAARAAFFFFFFLMLFADADDFDAAAAYRFREPMPCCALHATATEYYEMIFHHTPG